jgi:hypothetical protein
MEKQQMQDVKSPEVEKQCSIDQLKINNRTGSLLTVLLSKQQKQKTVPF